MITLPNANLLVSFVLTTRNRREVLTETLSRIRMCGLSADAFETIVVDNASADATPDAVLQDFPTVRLIRVTRDLGARARNFAVREARGRFVVFLQDDSYPMPGSIMRMIRRFEVFPRLGAAVFSIHRLDGSRECSAYPDVVLECGTGFRRRALTSAGGLTVDPLLWVDEYELSLRLLQAGWDIRLFDDLHVMRHGLPATLHPRQSLWQDVRRSVIVADRYLPESWRGQLRNDWILQQWLIAAAGRQRIAFVGGLLAGAAGALMRQRTPVDPDVFEQFTRMHQIATRLQFARQELGFTTLLLIDLGKNILPYWRAAQQCGVRIVAIADNRFATTACRYRGIPLVSDAVARRLNFDAALIANTSDVDAETRRSFWRGFDDRPVIDLYEPSFAFHASGADPAASESLRTAARSA